jgi:hypothetical protein
MSLQDGELIKNLLSQLRGKFFLFKCQKVTEIRINRNARSKDVVVTVNDSKCDVGRQLPPVPKSATAFPEKCTYSFQLYNN